MLISIVKQIVGLCSRFSWVVSPLAAIITAVSGVYATTHFAITTDINKLISPDLGWRQRELAYEKYFPGSFGSILVVVDAPTPELATEASAKLAQQLAERPDLFHVVRPLDGDPFFAKNGLLFQPEADLARDDAGLGRAGPVIGALAGDPTLRGLTRALSFGLLGVQNGQAKFEDLQRALTMSADTIDQVMAGQPASFSWRVLLTGQTSEAERASPLHRGPAGAGLLRVAAGARPRAMPSARLRPSSSSEPDYQARVRLTGPVAMADDEFGTLQEGAVVNVIGTIVIVLIILWLALHSPRIILAVFLNLAVGFAVTAALGLMMVGALNLISVAFAVLFVGLGVDFGIQFAVRSRSQRFKHGDLYSALGTTAEKVGAPLTLAAAAVAAGFLSFFPTDYKGVSELGQIAGIGMSWPSSPASPCCRDRGVARPELQAMAVALAIRHHALRFGLRDVPPRLHGLRCKIATATKRPLAQCDIGSCTSTIQWLSRTTSSRLSTSGCSAPEYSFLFVSASSR